MRPGQPVNTPFGLGTVRETRNGGRVLVDIRGRSVTLRAADLSPVPDRARGPRTRRAAAPVDVRPSDDTRASVSVDLHGLTVLEALARAEQALNDAALDDIAEVRLIHGRSGGRIRAALHKRLHELPSIRTFSLDPANDGVTVVRL